jgi:superfamily II DNA or RNA helicase
VTQEKLVEIRRREVWQGCQDLPEPDRLLVQLLSVCYESVPGTMLAAMLRGLPGWRPGGGAKALDSLQPVLLSLVERQILEDKGGKFRCSDLVCELATRQALHDGTFESLVETVWRLIPVREQWGLRGFRSYREAMREFRIAFYRQNLDAVNMALGEIDKNYPVERRRQNPFVLVCSQPYESEWIETLPSALLQEALREILTHSLLFQVPQSEACQTLLRLAQESPEQLSESLKLFLAEQLVWRGELALALQIGGGLAGWEGLALEAWHTFLIGEHGLALERFEKALKAWRQENQLHKAFFNSHLGVFFILALLREDTAESRRQAQQYLVSLGRKGDPMLTALFALLALVVRWQAGEDEMKAKILAKIGSMQPQAFLDTWLCALVLHWVGAAQAREMATTLEGTHSRALACGYRWFAAETAELLAGLDPANRRYGELAARLREEHGFATLADLIVPKAHWELALQALAECQLPQPENRMMARLVWHVALAEGKDTLGQLSPMLQKRTARGDWNRARPIALKRLVVGEASDLPLTPQDKRLCQNITVESGYYGKGNYAMDSQKAWPALVGHPLVFWADAPNVRLDVVGGEPELRITQSGDQLKLELFPVFEGTQEVAVVKENPTRLKVLVISDAHRRIAKVVGAGVSAPLAARQRVLKVVEQVSALVAVHSDIGGALQNTETVPADSRPYLLLMPFDEGLKVEVMVRPLAAEGASCHPGGGGANLVAEIDGRRLQTRRNLEEERQLALEVARDCPAFAGWVADDGSWTVGDPEACLELLLQIKALGDRVRVEWPRGEKMALVGQAGAKDFSLQIAREKGWFFAGGSLKVENGPALSMPELMGLLDRTESRFLPLEEGKFLALTREFRKRLDEFHGMLEPHEQGLRCHPLAALALNELTTDLGEVRTDSHWQALMQRYTRAMELRPEVPATLQAQLRDYQHEGFVWMSRLAAWGVGACLADDMGLGKTLQALAVILQRAPKGPTLVVAPTSVCLNWAAEIRRFAPTLNLHTLQDGERSQLIAELQPFDVLLCTYGLLPREVERLESVRWQTVVLDEAQAIKNIATQRAQAAMRLSAGFKLLTTGTPIENHLGELWNLFRFINPGLLGTQKNFAQNFTIPIEKNQDARLRHRLKKLIQPFILRRTKSEVLEELPERTEITLQIELSPEEKAFYDGLRRQAMKKLASKKLQPGEKQLQILAEITRLRQACCNPRLIFPESEIASAKLDAFGSIVEELLENQHKALVFSQFVGHLSLLREWLEARGIPYQYLDGSTPMRERQTSVERFQQGEGEVFLISLKAGGTGLNLTAADYVLHMDPWWNPAVEDQASDRIHRIGQKRPVTIYRLVAKDTIEEKIVEMHRHKRHLADSLLEGAQLGGKLSGDELLSLIQDAAHRR